MPPAASRRRGLASRLMLATLPLLTLPLAAHSFLPDFGFTSRAVLPLVCEAQRRPFDQQVEAKGELESAVNVEVKCEVKGRADMWIRILEVVPEGTLVKPGDFLARLDSSALEQDRLQQQIVCEQCSASLELARNNHIAALETRKSYLEGEFALVQQQVALRCFLAEEEQRKARESLYQSRRLAAKGFLNQEQLQADAFSLKKADNELAAARLQMQVLENLTKARRLRELDSAITISHSQVAACEQVLKVNERRLVEIGQQIERCVVRAPVAGQVVLAHLFHEGHAHMVEPGELAREGRVLVRLPDPAHMQIRGEIDEGDVALVKKGQPVTVRLEALPDEEVTGHVTWVAEYPKPQNWFQDGEKKYEAIIQLDAHPEALRPGLSVALTICAQHESAAVQVPCQSVLKHGSHSYVLLTDGDRWEARSVEPGPSNGRYTVIRSGLPEGSRVVLDPTSYRSKVQLPELPLGSG